MVGKGWQEGCWGTLSAAAVEKRKLRRPIGMLCLGLGRGLLLRWLCGIDVGMFRVEIRKTTSC